MRFWPEFGRWEKNCPLIRGVRLLEFPLIGENTVFPFVSESLFLITGTLRMCVCVNNYWKFVNNLCLRVYAIMFQETFMMGCDFNVVVITECTAKETFAANFF